MTPAPLDPHAPVEIAAGVWWVGCHLEGEAFQAHAYLVDGPQGAALIDPGSVLTWPVTRAKIAAVMPLSRVRWVVAQHQDPDVVGAVRDLAQDLPGPLTLVSHWRVHTIVKSYGAGLPEWRIEEHDWQLDLGGRMLRFVFTPYAHFPGAFTTFDEATGTLFTSDIFGAFTEGFQLYAQGEDYFDQAQPFHEHYMPSREVLLHAIEQFRKLPVARIAPQHGSIIEGPLVPYMYQRLSGLDCGLYLMTKTGREIMRLATLNREVRDLTQAVASARSLHDVIVAVEDTLAEMLPVEQVEAFAHTGEETCLHFEPLSQHRGRTAVAPAELHLPTTEAVRRVTLASGEALVLDLSLEPDKPVGPCGRLVVRLRPDEPCTARGLEDATAFLIQAQRALSIAVERAAEHRSLDLQRMHWLERSIQDPLTGLYSRLYMHLEVDRLLESARRKQGSPLALLMLDLDHFKRVNDTFGHVEGDRVLAAVGQVIQAAVRQTDMAVRLGGEEFAVFTSGNRDAITTAQRLQQAIRDIRLDAALEGEQFTVSIGVAHFRDDDTLESLIERADKRLYQAKKSGRDRIALG
ncbi:MAG: diguanylate cyclase [Myxococcales bacterium]|nr:diguanylate cyclase [Myxococcales bacterium]